MKKLFIAFFATCLILSGTISAWASCSLSGSVYCDANQNGEIDDGDMPLAGVGILVDGRTTFGIFTNGNGFYYTMNPLMCSSTSVSLNTRALPPDLVMVIPPTDTVPYYSGLVQDWLIDTAFCHGSAPYCGDGVLDTWIGKV